MSLAGKIVGLSRPNRGLASGRTARIVVTIVLVFLVWAAYAPLDEVVRGVGKVVPTMNNQVIQNLEGGIVREIFVTEGDIVEAGQIVVEMDKTQLSSSYLELEEQRRALTLRLARLDAERDMANEFVPDEALAQLAPEFAQSEQLLFLARRDELTRTLANLEEAVRLRMDETERLRVMAARQAVPQIDSIRTEQALVEAQTRLAASRTEFEASRAQEFSEVLSKLRQVEEAARAKEDQLSRTDVVTPIRGIVNRVIATTIGGVVRPGDPLVEILSLEDDLRVEGRISPTDVGYVYVGMPATIKLTAFDFSIYGTLTGTVSHVGADTVVDERSRDQQPYYEVFVELADTSLVGPEGEVEIRPGMQAQLELKSGDRTVLRYLLKPLFKASEALSER